MSDRPVSSEPLTGGHPPLAVAMAKAIHDVMPHYLPWPNSLTPCPAWDRHLGMTEAVIEHPIFAAAARSATPSSEEAGAALNNAYRERNAVVAALIRVGGYPAEVVMAPDTEGWWIVYAETPEGQVSWHIGPDDMDLFRDWPVAFGSRPSPWDGHSTEEKYRRVARLAATPDNTGRSREHDCICLPDLRLMLGHGMNCPANPDRRRGLAVGQTVWVDGIEYEVHREPGATTPFLHPTGMSEPKP